MIHYSLREAGVAVVLLCLGLSVGRHAGYFVAGVTIVSLLLFVCAWAGRFHTRKINAAVATFSVVLLWFASVDRSYFIWACSDCRLNKVTISYRIFCKPVYSVDHHFCSDIDKTFVALDFPCPHVRADSQHRRRAWGLIYVCCPDVNGTMTLRCRNRVTSDHIWRLKIRASRDPEFASSFYDRVIGRHDYRYFYRVAVEENGPIGGEGDHP